MVAALYFKCALEQERGGAMRFRIKELAQERGMTADDLARASDMKYNTIINLYQNRVGNPAYGTLRAVARALGVSVEELETEDSREKLPIVV
jgi:transcriptional regulator with XRE-family HTH domain